MFLTLFNKYKQNVINPFNYVSGFNPKKLIMKSETTVKPKILDAYVASNAEPGAIKVPFTNKLKMIIDLKWDGDIGDAPLGSDALLGGLNVSDVAKVYPNATKVFLVAKYLFEKNMDKIPDDELASHIKFILVDFAKKVIFRDEVSSETIVKPEKMVFGEMLF
jgi:hypothetical protein